MEIERELALLRESWTETFDQLFVLYEVAREVSSVPELDKVLEHVVNHAFLLLESEAIALLLVDQQGKKLTVKVLKNDKSDDAKSRERDINIGEGIAGDVARSGKFVVSPQDVDEKAFRVDSKVLGVTTAKNLLCVPITLRGEIVIGVIEVVNRKNGTFTAKDKDFLLAISNISALAIENARINMQLQDSKKIPGQLTETLASENAKLAEKFTALTAENTKAVKQLQESENSKTQMTEKITALTVENLRISKLLQDGDNSSSQTTEKVTALTAENAKIGKQLKDNEKYQGQLLESFPEGFIAVNNQGKITHLNSTALKLLGITDATSFMGQPGSSALKDEMELLGFIHAALAEGQVQKWKELTLKRTGKMVYLFTCVFKGEDNSVLGAGAAMQDMILRR